MDDRLIYDWNRESPPPKPALVSLNDETLRDGLQSPSVRAPSIDQKIHILHLLDRIGIDTADIGLAGRRASCGPRRRTARRGDRQRRPEDTRQLRGADGHRRHPADRGHRAANRRPDRVLLLHRIESRSAAMPKTGRWTTCSGVRRRPSALPCRHGLDVMYVTEDTTRSDPETLRRLFTTAIHAGASRICIADTVGHATPGGRAGGRPFRQTDHRGARAVDVAIDWHGHRDRDMGTINSHRGARSGRDARPWDGPRAWRAGWQHADRSAPGQSGADGLDHPRSDPPERARARPCPRRPASRFRTTIPCSAATLSGQPRAFTPPRS